MAPYFVAAVPDGTRCAGVDPGRRQDAAGAVGADQRGEAIARPRRDLAADHDRVEAVELADAGVAHRHDEAIEVGGAGDRDLDLDVGADRGEQLPPHRHRDRVGGGRVVDRDAAQRRAGVLGDQPEPGRVRPRASR